MEIPITFSESSNKDVLLVDKQMADGKFSVYKVHGAKNKKEYALKIFPKDQASMVQYRKETLIYNLDHINVIKSVPLKSSFVEAHLLLTEFAKYGDFFDLVTKGFINTEVLIRTYFHQLLEGVQYIHNKGIAHLDLKLENIMLGGDFMVKIIDFDQSQKTSDKLITSGGTTGYRAPEVLSGLCSNLTAADIYSMGIILYAFKAREFPFMECEDSEAKQLNDVKYYNTFAKNNSFFWQKKAELKKDKNFFSEDFITLVNGMLNPSANQRFKLEDIKNSNWYKGATLSLNDLKMEMKARLDRINKSKSRS